MTKFQTVPHELRLFRRGDFYEAFDKDAEIIGRELEIPVTQTLGANPRPLARRTVPCDRSAC